MLYTKFQGHQRRRFLKGFYPKWAWWPPWSHDQDHVPPSHGGSIWNLALIGPVVSEKMFEECWRQTDNEDDRRMTECAYTISSPMSLKAQVSYKCILIQLLLGRMGVPNVTIFLSIFQESQENQPPLPLIPAKKCYPLDQKQCSTQNISTQIYMGRKIKRIRQTCSSLFLTSAIDGGLCSRSRPECGLCCCSW